MCTEPYSFLVNNTTLSSGNPLHLKKNLIEQLYNMTLADNIRYWNREIAKISALSSEFVTGKELKPTNVESILSQ